MLSVVVDVVTTFFKGCEAFIPNHCRVATDVSKENDGWMSASQQGSTGVLTI